jgi:hypothetical protein
LIIKTAQAKRTVINMYVSGYDLDDFRIASGDQNSYGRFVTRRHCGFWNSLRAEVHLGFLFGQ